VAINRVAKVVQGGRRFSFTGLVVVGDGEGHDTGGLLTDHRMGDSTTDQRHLEEMLLGFLNGLGGSSNAINVVHATVDALQQLEEPEEVARRRGKSVASVRGCAGSHDDLAW
jgi:small subunit ribosomal protein S5